MGGTSVGWVVATSMQKLQKTPPPHLYMPKMVILLLEVTSMTQNTMQLMAGPEAK